MSGEAGLRVGAARVDITPPGPVSMAGFASRTGPSEGVYRPLHLRVALFESDRGGERRRALIASADLLNWGPERVAGIRERVAAASGVPASAQLLAATHSHSGPQTTRWMAPSVGVADDAYLLLLEERLLEAVSVAEAGLEPVRAVRQRGRFGLCRYRRRLEGPPPEGDELGPRDQEVTAVALRRPAGDAVATLVHYTCHPVINAGPLLTDEYPGAAMSFIEEGAGGVALFLQGCCGDINPLEEYHRSGPERALAEGRRLGEAVLDMLAAGGEELGATAVAGCVRRIGLPLRGVPDEGDVAAACVLPGVRGEWGRFFRAHPERLRGWMPLELQRLDLARGLSLLAMNAEVSVEYGLEAKSRSRGAVLPVAYSNGAVGYTPTARQLANGGYEAEESTLYYLLPSPYAPRIDPLIRAGVRDVMKAPPR